MEDPTDQTVYSTDDGTYAMDDDQAIDEAHTIDDSRAIDVLVRLEHTRSRRDERRDVFEIRLKKGRKYSQWAKQEKQKWQERDDRLVAHWQKMEELRLQRKQERKDYILRERQDMVLQRVAIPPNTFIARFLREERQAYLINNGNCLDSKEFYESDMSVIPAEFSQLLRSKPRSPVPPMKKK